MVEADEQSPPHRQIIHIPDKESPTYGAGYYGEGREIPPIKFCARAAKDDEIKFNGPNVTLFVPHGLGKKIYQQILEALGEAD